ncbi:MAG: hypothetical protein COA32_11145 [Fluviicola sp.]|nr:MAG: hypothetical protein COA32_11145 [Fluviicola sp.]
MDNRIPKIIQDFQESKESKREIDFLSFDNWLSKQEHKSQDWIVIARNQKVGEFEDYYTISCLISSVDQSFNRFLSDSHWFIDSSFGIPQKYQKPYEDEPYEDGLKAKLNDVNYEPFTFSRHFNGYVSDYFQVIEHFLLYYNCFWLQERQEYQSMSESGEIITVLKHIKENDNEQILIDAHTLRDYLAVRNMTLARFHDHRRRSEYEISDFLEEEAITYSLSNNESYFDLDLRIDIQYKNVKSTSRLLGKDIVQPYPSPESHEWKLDKDEDDYLEFVIGRNTEGKEIRSTCNPDALSNYFTDKGTPHFLTPVYFKREMLQKYYSEPKKYTTSEVLVEYLNIWGIQIDTTNENLVQVYLGDIGQNLPYKEQLHWRQFNVVPKGKISEHRFKRDFLTQFASPEINEAPIIHFKESFEVLQTKFIDVYGSTLFKALAKDDEHLYSTLHIPLTDEWKELDEQILALAKITTDSFNNQTLKSITCKKIGDLGTSGNPIKGLSGLFYEYLTQQYSEEEKRDSLILPFNTIQAIRSSSVAHRKSKELEKTLVKYGLQGISNEERFRKIVVEITKAFKAIAQGIK